MCRGTVEAYEQRRLLTSKLRWRILERDDFRCILCGADAATDRNVRLDVDHIIAIARGGKTVPENLRTLCSRCNNGKGDRI
jgi:5-methylcytosine-specific restriction endonuclease McrA